jgi:purine-binding chemotaxis protein CheW
MTLPVLGVRDPVVDMGRQEIQLACFKLAAEMYAVDIMRIKEIIRPQKLTTVPHAAAFVDGMINLRGTVIPVVDLRKRFGLPRADGDRRTRVIICAVTGKFVGLLVDEVTEVRQYLRREVRPTPEFVKGKGVDLFMAVCQRENDLVMLIDLEKLFTASEIQDLDKFHPDK